MQRQIATVKKAKEDASALLQEKAEVDKEKAGLLKAAEETELVMNKKLGTVGNIIHTSVPVHNNEDHNPTLKTWAPEGVDVDKKREGLLSHHEVLLRLDGYAPEAGVKVVGHRGYFLRCFPLGRRWFSKLCGAKTDAVLQTMGSFPEPGHYQYVRDFHPATLKTSVARKQALTTSLDYGLEFLTTKKGFTALQCPYFMSKDVMAKTAQLDDFE